jgi:hypothetical protein
LKIFSFICNIENLIVILQLETGNNTINDDEKIF